MEIRFSPYNSPFVPAGPPGVHWIGREFRDMPHSAHVYEYQRELGRRHVEQLNLELTSAVALLPMLDEMAADGIKAAARRAKDIRHFLNPYKSSSVNHSSDSRNAKGIRRASSPQGMERSETRSSPVGEADSPNKFINSKSKKIKSQKNNDKPVLQIVPKKPCVIPEFWKGGLPI